MPTKFGNIEITTTGENHHITKITDGAGVLDFTDESMIHPIKLFLIGKSIQVTNTYARNQHFRINEINDKVVGMLLSYVENPAVAYRKIHVLGCEGAIGRMRQIFATYVTHLSRTDSAAARDWITKYLRVLTTLGDAKITSELEAAIDHADQHGEFIRTLKQYLDNDTVTEKYIDMLELYYGFINKELLTVDMILSCPINQISVRGPTREMDEWALANNIITAEQCSE